MIDERAIKAAVRAACIETGAEESWVFEGRRDTSCDYETSRARSYATHALIEVFGYNSITETVVWSLGVGRSCVNSHLCNLGTKMQSNWWSSEVANRVVSYLRSFCCQHEIPVAKVVGARTEKLGKLVKSARPVEATPPVLTGMAYADAPVRIRLVPEHIRRAVPTDIRRLTLRKPFHGLGRDMTADLMGDPSPVRRQRMEGG